MTGDLVVYFAGPLFTLAERNFNRELAGQLNYILPNIKIILPQIDSSVIMNESKSPILLFDHLVQSIKKADLVIAILDGSDVDSGTSFEIGYAYGLKKPIIGIRTDFRKSEDRGVNLMLSRSMTKLFYFSSTNTTMGDVATNIAKWVIKLSNERMNANDKKKV